MALSFPLAFYFPFIFNLIKPVLFLVLYILIFYILSLPSLFHVVAEGIEAYDIYLWVG